MNVGRARPQDLRLRLRTSLKRTPREVTAWPGRTGHSG
ncbi:hypothetical protein EV644_12374 [Kribbella orskensis]|uniref:Uncharacterized protein n=1 Tax=Kribbella orskensis TaxID=2512216 RepID=A0ABY2BA34_9ACTN|nr:hypothetical protein EV642_12549 [Kribbella sp. VKM Ac-2500]TCO13242.1 hypothetical protein EV644_12374 [Kribbella orskensis]